jgi:hypothetical protein
MKNLVELSSAHLYGDRCAGVLLQLWLQLWSMLACAAVRLRHCSFSVLGFPFCSALSSPDPSLASSVLWDGDPFYQILPNRNIKQKFQAIRIGKRE